MELRVVDAGRLDELGAALVREALSAAGRDAPTLMPALGSSALGIYAALGRQPGLRLVQLDEYRVPADDPRSLIGWLRRDVATPLGVAEEGIVALDGGAADAGAACRAFDAAVAAAGGVDVAVLGLGPNGHLGFNEPPSDRSAPTRVVELDEVSLAANARYWPGLDVPRAAMTAGMSTILAARSVILVVTGTRKRDILGRLLDGRVTADLPASFLREHPNAVLLADADAAP